jgi:pilus assembly protein CpaC
VPKDKSVAIRLSGPATQIVVAQPDIAEIVVTTDQSFYIRGKAMGATNILIYGPGKQLREVVDVKVGHDLDALRSDLAELFPGENITVRDMAGGLLLTGDAPDNGVALRIKAAAERYAPAAVTSNLTVRASQQVVLEVRIIEASRRSLTEFGFEIRAGNQSGIAFASGSGLLSSQAPAAALALSTPIGTGNLAIALRALEEKGVINTLAQPKLVALSGEPASFLAGGEFPFPVPMDNNRIAIEFRPFGVKLDFLPVITDNGLIRLKVSPEVSQLDDTRGLRLNGFQVPSLSMRRASTTVELVDGESLAMAGLFQNGSSNAMRRLPGAGEIPILGALFRSKQWQNDQTELVIIITPRIANGPLPLTGALATGRAPSAIDLILQGIAEDRPIAPIAATQG